MNNLQREDMLALVTNGRSWSRRDFIASSIAAGFALAAGPVCAQTTVVTGTQGLTAGMVDILARDGEIPAYRAMPATGRNLPVILVVQEIFGVHEHIRDVCRRFARRGYLAIAPDLHYRQGDVSQLKDNKDILEKVVAHVPDGQVMGDLDAAAAWAAKNKGDIERLGVNGFCWGGRIAWLYTAHNSRAKAAVAWYGRLAGDKTDTNPRHPIDMADKLKAPVLGLYGGADSGIPIDTVERMRDAVKSAGKQAEIIVYPDTPHAFHADYRPSYRKEPAEDGWRRALAWFKQHDVA